MPKLYRKRTILLKKESSYGTDPTPTGSANAVRVRDLTVEPVVSDEVSRDTVRGYLGNFETLLANTRVTATFECELVGSGTAGTAPKFGPALEACGMDLTTVSNTSDTYAPVSASFPSVTIYYNTDGIRHKITGARGSFSLNCEVGQIPTISFSFTGIYNAPTDTAVPTCTYSNQASPLIFTNGNTSAFSIYGYGAALQSWSFDMNNELVYRELVGGTKEVMITDRAPSGTASVEMVALSAHNFFTDATGSSTGTNTWLHGTTAGNKVTVSCPKSDLSTPTYSDSDGIVMLDLPFMATPNAGNDEISIAFT
jgi:hypothetical protein